MNKTSVASVLSEAKTAFSNGASHAKIRILHPGQCAAGVSRPSIKEDISYEQDRSIAASI